MKTLSQWLRVIGGILLLPFLLVILLIVKPIEWLWRRFVSPVPAENRADMDSEQFILLNTTLQKLLQAQSSEEATRILQQHPELLTDEADTLLGFYIEEARKQGDEEAVQFFKSHREALQLFRSQLQGASQQTTTEHNDIPAHFLAIIDQAKAAEARYQQGQGVPALNEAIAAWEQILNHPEFAKADAKGKLRLVVLNNSATTFRHRYRATGVLADLDKALSSWEEVANSVPSDFPKGG